MWAVIGCVLLAACGSKIKAPPEPPMAIRRADDAFRYRHYADAVALYGSYTDVVDKDEYTARALYKKALAQYQLGRYADVLVTLQDLQNRYPTARWVQVDALRGDSQRALGRPVAAIESWDRGWEAATEADRTRLRVRIGTVARDMNTAELDEAREVVTSPDVAQMLDYQLAKREKPELDEPLPEFEAPEGTAVAESPGAAEAPVVAKTESHAETQAAVATGGAGAAVAAADAGAAPPEAADSADTVVAEPAPEAPTEPAVENAAVEAPAAAPAVARTETALPETIAGDAARVGVFLTGTAGENERVVRALQMVLGEQALVVKEATAAASSEKQAFEELVDDPRVLAVIGPVETESARLVAEAATRQRIPLLELSSASDTSARPFVLHAGVSRAELLPELLDYAMNRARLRQFGVIYPDNVSGQAFYSSFKASVDRRGGKVIGTDAYSPDAKSLTAGLVQRWRDKDNLQALVLSDGSIAAETFAKFLQREMPDITLLGVNDWDALAGNELALSGVVFASVFVADAPRPATREFVQQYQDAFHQTPVTIQALAYEAALIVKHGLQSGAASRGAMWEAIEHSPIFDGPTGPVRIVGNQLERQPVVVRLSNGKLEAVETSTAPVAPETVTASAQ